MRTSLATSAVLSSIVFSMLSFDASAATFYVSPSGSDENPGSESRPLRTFFRAATIARPGDTFIFENGLYLETQPPWINRTSPLATAGTPIVFRSRNKHAAVINFQNMPNEKILIRQHYVTIQDFEITQNVQGGTNDHLVFAYEGSSHVSIIGNRIHNAVTDCVKGDRTDHLVVRGNLCYDVQHEGIDVLNSFDVTVAGNEIWNVGDAAILLKGGGRDFKVFDNYIHAGTSMAYGIALGGVSCAECTFDFSSSGYEAYNSVAYNNVVVSNPAGTIHRGLALIGAADTALVNNVVVGARTAIVLVKAADAQHGWAWDPLVKDPVVQNNIVQHCTVAATSFADVQGTLTHDYNTYFDCPNAAAQEHGLTSDPLFVDPLKDWHLRPGSPSAASGTVIPPRSGNRGAAIDVRLDRSGIARTAPWDRGVYVSRPPPPAPIDLRIIRMARHAAARPKIACQRSSAYRRGPRPDHTQNSAHTINLTPYETR